MPDDIKDLPDGGNTRETRLADALSERYLAYALSTITARSLPDVRDGLSRCIAGCCGRCISCGSILPPASRNARASSAT